MWKAKMLIYLNELEVAYIPGKRSGYYEQQWEEQCQVHINEVVTTGTELLGIYIILAQAGIL